MIIYEANLFNSLLPYGLAIFTFLFLGAGVLILPERLAKLIGIGILAIAGAIAFSTFQTFSSPQTNLTGVLQAKQEVRCNKSSVCRMIRVQQKEFFVKEETYPKLQISSCYRIAFYPHDALNSEDSLITKITQQPEQDCKG